MPERRTGHTVLAMDRLSPNTQPPAAGELLLQGALLSLYVGLRSGAWAVGTLERAVGRR